MQRFYMALREEGVGIKRVKIVETPLGWPRSWAHVFKPKEFKIEDVPGWPAKPPEACMEHVDEKGESICFLVWAKVPEQSYCEGTWKLLTELDIPSEMPGTNRKLLTFTTKGMDSEMGGWIRSLESRGYLFADGAKFFDSGPIPHRLGEWDIKTWTLDKPVDNVKKLNFHLHQLANAAVYGWVRRHTAEITLSGEYYVDVPPARADVTVGVVDKTTGKPVYSAYVALMIGDIVYGDGYTGGDGKIVFTEIEEGTYVLHVEAANYRPKDTTIEVKPPKVYKSVELTPIPTPPFPWEWVAIGVGVVVVGGVVIALARRREVL
jgi:hypothetical protein